jgi:hypothetical protein
MVEKTFKLHGFTFTNPVVNGERTSVFGWLNLQKDNGDLYDMYIQIDTVNIGDSLIRAHILVVVPELLSDTEMEFVLELWHQFLTAAAQWDEGSTWVNANLPHLDSLEGKRAITNSGTFQARMTAGTSEGDFAYSLTLWVDPVSTVVGENIHISVNALTPLMGEDYLILSSWDYEEEKSWRTYSVCEPGSDADCETDTPQITVTNTGITVREGFPVTYDEWLISFQSAGFSENIYPERSLQLEVIFHGIVYICMNNEEINPLIIEGSTSIFVDYNNGDWELISYDMFCVEN